MASTPGPNSHDRTAFWDTQISSVMHHDAEVESTQLVGASNQNSTTGAQSPSHHSMALPNSTRVEEFEIVNLLGVGGFGIVYLAQDHALGRLVALKEYMPSGLAMRNGSTQVQVRTSADVSTFELGMRSFVNEARLLAKFDHRSLLKVYRFWQANGTAYMVTPYYQGLTLAQARDSKSAWAMGANLRALMTSVAGALEVLHGENVFHRDVAPDNIFLLADGRPVLLDFGAARAVIGERTQSLTAILKPSFAPVEQYSQSGVLRQGPWTDLYALGGVMVYCVTGKTPSPSVGRAIADDYEPLASQTGQHANWGVDRQFCLAVDWCLRVRPQERPQTVAELLAVLCGDAQPPASPHEGTFRIAAPAGERRDAQASTVPLDSIAMANIAHTIAATAGDAAVTAFAKTTIVGKADGASALAPHATSPAKSVGEASPPKKAGASAPVGAGEATKSTKKWAVAAGLAVAAAALLGVFVSMGKSGSIEAARPVAPADIAGSSSPFGAAAVPAGPTIASSSQNGSLAVGAASQSTSGTVSLTTDSKLASIASTSTPTSVLATATASIAVGAASRSNPSVTATSAAVAASRAARAALVAAASRRTVTQVLTPVRSNPTPSPAAPAVSAVSEPAAADPIRTGTRTPTPPVATVAAVRAPLDPDSACADRILLGKQLCLSRTCRLAPYEKHPDCVRLRDIEDARQSAGQNR